MEATKITLKHLRSAKTFVEMLKMLVNYYHIMEDVPGKILLGGITINMTKNANNSFMEVARVIKIISKIGDLVNVLVVVPGLKYLR